MSFNFFFSFKILCASLLALLVYGTASAERVVKSGRVDPSDSLPIIQLGTTIDLQADDWKTLIQKNEVVRRTYQLATGMALPDGMGGTMFECETIPYGDHWPYGIAGNPTLPFYCSFKAKHDQRLWSLEIDGFYHVTGFSTDETDGGTGSLPPDHKLMNSSSFVDPKTGALHFDSSNELLQKYDFGELDFYELKVEIYLLNASISPNPAAESQAH